MGVELVARVEGFGPVDIDGVSIFYICLAVLWTAALAGGMTFLYRKREMPIVKIRGLPLAFGAVILLHLYWLAVQFGYIYGARMAAAIEFWIMGIWLPFGIALFHASNSRFLHVAKMQKRFVGLEPLEHHRVSSHKKKSLIQRYRGAGYMTRMLVLICAGMAFQVRSLLDLRT